MSETSSDFETVKHKELHWIIGLILIQDCLDNVILSGESLIMDLLHADLLVVFFGMYFSFKMFYSASLTNTGCFII